MKLEVSLLFYNQTLIREIVHNITCQSREKPQFFSSNIISVQVKKSLKIILNMPEFTASQNVSFLCEEISTDFKILLQSMANYFKQNNVLIRS